MTAIPNTMMLNYDGIGINGADEYRSRIATFNQPDGGAEYGALFAAAPELLAALEQAEMDYAELLAYMRAKREPDNVVELVKVRRSRARAAIAKARGA